MSEDCLDKQAVLEATTMDIVTQGGPSYEKDGCRYRSDDGRRCAIGHLIDDEFYMEYYEGQSVDDEVFEAVEETLGISLSGSEIDFLVDVQKAHDAVANEEDFFDAWAELLKGICSREGLRFPEELV